MAPHWLSSNVQGMCQEVENRGLLTVSEASAWLSPCSCWRGLLNCHLSVNLFVHLCLDPSFPDLPVSSRTYLCNFDVNHDSPMVWRAVFPWGWSWVNNFMNADAAFVSISTLWKPLNLLCNPLNLYSFCKARVCVCIYCVLCDWLWLIIIKIQV